MTTPLAGLGPTPTVEKPRYFGGSIPTVPLLYRDTPLIHPVRYSRDMLLATRLEQSRTLSYGQMMPIVDEVLVILSAARRVHRHLSPKTVRLSPIEIIDLGLKQGGSPPSSGSSPHEPNMTAFDATLGQFAYMAPEQVRGKLQVDARADLYAVGAILFRSLTGRLPFEGGNALSLIALKLDRDAPSLQSVTGRTWPNNLEEFVAKLLARDPRDRYANADEALVVWRKMTLN